MEISIHALREEGDHRSGRPDAQQGEDFYPRPPRGGRRSESSIQRPYKPFLSTPSARRATALQSCEYDSRSISIHALREEGDALQALLMRLVPAFLSTPSARRATRPVLVRMAPTVFLSTPSARRATWKSFWNFWRGLYFYPRPPRGGRLFRVDVAVTISNISIHALREEGDDLRSGVIYCKRLFLSTPSARRATYYLCGNYILSWHFYPRPPRGGRRLPAQAVCCAITFLSTPSARRATFADKGQRHKGCISIHALREEGDDQQERVQLQRDISIHALREEGDCLIIKMFWINFVFLSTPSARRATGHKTRRTEDLQKISIHALREEGDSKNREKILCFCLSIYQSAQNW